MTLLPPFLHPCPFSLREQSRQTAGPGNLGGAGTQGESSPNGRICH